MLYWQGREKLKDAYYIFQEQIDRHGATPLLLVGQSTALILQEKFEEAESLLQVRIFILHFFYIKAFQLHEFYR